jgi:ribonuclease P protein component
MAMKRLKGKKIIDALFSEGQHLSVYPLKVVFRHTNKSNLLGVSVSKKHFKNAVDRNKIKRLLRAVSKDPLEEILSELDLRFQIMILYIGQDMPNTTQLKPRIKSLIKQLKKTTLKVNENIEK